MTHNPGARAHAPSVAAGFYLFPLRGSGDGNNNKKGKRHVSHTAVSETCVPVGTLVSADVRSARPSCGTSSSWASSVSHEPLAPLNCSPLLFQNVIKESIPVSKKKKKDLELWLLRTAAFSLSVLKQQSVTRRDKKLSEKERKSLRLRFRRMAG